LVEDHGEETTSCAIHKQRERERVLFATHQQVGPAADWWDAYVEAHEEPKTINWYEFRNSFRTHHVPLGVMKLKKKKFKVLM
jgi:hypothetical protein